MKTLRSVIWRVIISVMLFAGYIFSIGVYNSIHSPMTGVATARALDDTMGSYVVAKFIREDNITTFIFIIFLLLFMATWFSLILRIAKTKPEQPAN